MQPMDKGPRRKNLRETKKETPSRRRTSHHSFDLEEGETNPGLLRLWAAEELADEFGNDVSEWLV